MDGWKNQLFFGDNLDILHSGHIPVGIVDLIYLDPPFNSNATYNILFAEKSGEKSAAQITAFEDTWHWGEEAMAAYDDAMKLGVPLITASSNEGDIVLDPFCGCGTTITVAERLKRRWIGIDITHLAITLIKKRLHDTYGPELAPYEVVGEPADVMGAEAPGGDQPPPVRVVGLRPGGCLSRPGQEKGRG